MSDSTRSCAVSVECRRRLQPRHEVVRLKVLDELLSNDLLDHFRHKREVWCRPVILQLAGVQWWLLQQRCDDGAFLRSRQTTFAQRSVQHRGQERKQYVGRFLQYEGRDGIQRTRLGEWRHDHSAYVVFRADQQLCQWPVSGTRWRTVRCAIADEFHTLSWKNPLKSSAVCRAVAGVLWSSSRRSSFDSDRHSLPRLECYSSLFAVRSDQYAKVVAWRSGSVNNTQYSICPKRSAICNRRFPGPNSVVDANFISSASAVFVRLTRWQTDWQTTLLGR